MSNTRHQEVKDREFESSSAHHQTLQHSPAARAASGLGRLSESGLILTLGVILLERATDSAVLLPSGGEICMCVLETWWAGGHFTQNGSSGSHA